MTSDAATGAAAPRQTFRAYVRARREGALLGTRLLPARVTPATAVLCSPPSPLHWSGTAPAGRQGG
jgi:hypothetical protein